MDELEPMIATAICRFAAIDGGRSVAIEIVLPETAQMALDVGGDVVRPVASVLKIALAMAVYDAAANGELDLEEPIARAQFRPTRYVSILNAFPGERALTLREWTALAMMTSDNPLAVMLTERVTPKAVGGVLERAGCRTSNGLEAGFTEAELGKANRRNIMSARDVLRLLAALEAERYDDIRAAMSNNLRGTRMPARLPDSALTAHKTGSLEGVVNDAGIVSDTIGGLEIRFRAAFLTDGQCDPLVTGAAIADCTRAIYDALAAFARG